MSLGADFGRSDEIDAEASDNASLAGVSVVAAAGNSGQSAYIASSPASSTRAISVAAVDAVPSFPTAIVDFQTAANEQVKDLNGAEIAKPISGDLNVFTDDGTTLCDPNTGIGCEETGCDAGAYTFNNFADGDIAVVLRGGCARVQKAQVGDAEGADAVVMINNSPGLPALRGRHRRRRHPVPGRLERGGHGRQVHVRGRQPRDDHRRTHRRQPDLQAARRL